MSAASSHPGFLWSDSRCPESHSYLAGPVIAEAKAPYHSYLTLAPTGKMDQHFDALQTHGHIKCWSVKTLTALLTKAGFESFSWSMTDRIPPLAKSMLVEARKGDSRL